MFLLQPLYNTFNIFNIFLRLYGCANYNVNKFTLIIINMRLDESNECHKHHLGFVVVPCFPSGLYRNKNFRLFRFPLPRINSKK